MTNKEIVDKIYNSGIVPVVVLDSENQAVPLMKSLILGSINCAEITFRTKAAEKSIYKIKQEFPDAFIGAGTVSSGEIADAAVKAGAEFIVTPGINTEVIEWCIAHNIFVVPGVATASEIEKARSYGLNILKFFPAVAAGGTDMLKNFFSPYSDIKFLVTGGLTENNFNDFLRLPNVLACGGSWLCSKALLEDNRFDEIMELSKNAIRRMHDFRIYHIGINCTDDKQAFNFTNKLSDMFMQGVTKTDKSYFSGSMFELIGNPVYGEKGHICIEVNNLERAISFFKNKNINFLEETYNAHSSIYFKEQVDGFAVHLLERKR